MCRNESAGNFGRREIVAVRTKAKLFFRQRKTSVRLVPPSTSSSPLKAPKNNSPLADTLFSCCRARLAWQDLRANRQFLPLFTFCTLDIWANPCFDRWFFINYSIFSFIYLTWDEIKLSTMNYNYLLLICLLFWQQAISQPSETCTNLEHAFLSVSDTDEVCLHSR